MAMREERGYQTYEAENTATQDVGGVEAVVEVDHEMPHTTPPTREWDGVRWVPPSQDMADTEEASLEETETLSPLAGNWSTRIKCGMCRTSNFYIEPDRTFHGVRVDGQWSGYSMLLCPVCGNGRPHVVTMDENNIGYWLLGLKKVE